MNIPNCKVKSVKADIAAGEFTFTFKVEINDENMETANDLAHYVDKVHGDVDLLITPRQIPLFPK